MQIQTKICHINNLSPAEKQAASEIDRIAFAGDSGEDGITTWATSEWMTLGFAGDQLVSVVGILVREASLDGQPIILGGIGGVATLPEWRRKGFAGTLLDRAAEFLLDPLKVDFGFLVCANEKTRWYSSHGWQQINGQVYIDQPGGKMIMEGPNMILPVLKTRWLEGCLDLCGLPW